MAKRMDRDVAKRHGDRIRQMYDEYAAFRAAKHEEVRARVEAEIAAEVDAKLAEVSREVRTAYELGVPKGVLREATRAYTNASSWDKVWNAAADEAPVVDRGRNAPTSVEPFELVYDDPADAKEKYIEAGKKATFVVRTGPDGLPWSEPLHLMLEKKSLTGPWIQDPDVGWYDVELETGDRYIKPEYAALGAYGETDEDAIRTIEKAISDAHKGK